MKLSDAVMLGSSVVRPERGVLLVDWYDGKRGCALGMACEAEGITVKRDAKSQSSLELIHKHWPWTKHRMIRNDETCCHQIPHCDAALFIAHVFDDHVATTIPVEGNLWSLEKLVDWIRANEPEEVHASETIREVQSGQGPRRPTPEVETFETITK